MASSTGAQREAAGEYARSHVCLACRRCPDPSEGADKLLKCSRCKFAAYCNGTCQTNDWQRHKKEECAPIIKGLAAGKTLSEIVLELKAGKPEDAEQRLYNPRSTLTPLPTCKRKIKLQRFYPALALIAYCARLKADYPTLEFVTDYYVKSVRQQRDGSTVVSYGDKTPSRCIEQGPKAWYPGATSDKQAVRLMERMRGTGFLLELALGILMAVRTNLYAKDACFTYFDKPITDFGVATGKVKIASEDLLFTRSPDCTPDCTHNFQDPLDHYWLYFVAGDETIFYDFSLLIYNFEMFTATQPYVIGQYANATGYLPNAIPGVEFGRAMAIAGGGMKLHHERDGKSRYSVAQSPDIPETAQDLENYRKFLKNRQRRQTLLDITHTIRDGRRQDNAPDDLSILATSVFYREAVMYLQDALPTAYKSFPANVPIGTGIA